MKYLWILLSIWLGYSILAMSVGMRMQENLREQLSNSQRQADELMRELEKCK